MDGSTEDQTEAAPLSRAGKFGLLVEGVASFTFAISQITCLSWKDVILQVRSCHRWMTSHWLCVPRCLVSIYPMVVQVNGVATFSQL